LTSHLRQGGSRRSGDAYQDVVALEVLVEWLEHPDRYRGVRLEDDEAGSLDDVVAFRSDGSVKAVQVKFSVHPDLESDEWDWADLLDDRPSQAKTGKRPRLPGLWQKWAGSFTDLSAAHGSVDAVVVSNRRAAPSLASALTDTGRIDPDRVGDPDVLAALHEQAGGDAQATAVFNGIRFELDRPSLPGLEAAVRRRFDKLGGTEAGWHNLRDELRSWVLHRAEPNPDGVIRLPDIRRAAQWYSLQSLPQRFEIPDPYIVPSEEFHDSLMERLRASSDDTVVVIGSPGTGKSTYTSYLFEKLESEKIPVIRHHYFLSLEDYDATRLDHDAAAQSLMHDVQAGFAEALDGLDATNPSARDLRPWLEKCGSFYSATEKPFVVILDGLDHVWRERNSAEELAKLLELLLPPPDGVVVLLATQPVDPDVLPTCLVRAAPSDTWLELPELGLGEVRKWLEPHAREILGEHDEEPTDFLLDELASSLLQKTGGHPLQLRYVVRTIQEQSLTLVPASIDRLPGTGDDDITTYYSDLWRSIDEVGELILHLLAVCGFSLPTTGLYACLEGLGFDPAASERGLKQVRHLLQQDALGLRAFHGSLLVFVRDLSEHKHHQDRVREAVISWLANSAPEHWRWSYHWKLCADGGDSGPLKEGPDRAWAVQALANVRDTYDASEILRRSSWTALTDGDLPRAMELSALNDYLDRSREYEPATMESLLLSGLLRSTDPFLRTRLEATANRLTSSELVLLVEAEAQAMNWKVVRRLRDEVLRRLRASQIRADPERGDSITERVVPFLSVEALQEEPDDAFVLRVAIANRDAGIAGSFLATFAEQIRIRRDTISMRRLLQREGSIGTGSFAVEDDGDAEAHVALNSDERGGLLEQAVLLALSEAVDFDADLIRPENNTDPMIAVYAWCREIENYDMVLEFLPEWGVGDPLARRPAAGDVVTVFWMLANHLHGSPDANLQWIGTHTPSGLDKELANHFNSVAQGLSDGLKNRSASVAEVFQSLGSMPLPGWPATRDAEARLTARRGRDVGLALSFDLSAVLRGAGLRGSMDDHDVRAVLESDYCDPVEWFRECARRRITGFTAQALDYMVTWHEETWCKSVRPFSERAETSALVAVVLAINNDLQRAFQLMVVSAENLLAHGYHKDALLFAPLEAVKLLHSEGAADVEILTRILVALAPAIAEVENFTDSDETGWLPRELSTVLARVNPALAIKYYLALKDQDEHFDAQFAFGALLRVLDLSDGFAKAIAGTAIDPGALRALEGRAEQEDADAGEVVETILDFLRPSSIVEPPEDPRAPSRDTQREPPEFADFPPERLADFRQGLRVRKIYHEDEPIESWVAHWVAAGSAVEVLEAMGREVNRDPHFRAADLIFDVTLSQVGELQAYPWLVRAQVETHGWNKYFGGEDTTRRRSKIVRERYPDRWLDFIGATFSSVRGAPWSGGGPSYHCWARLIQYLLDQGRSDLALEATEKALQVALELIPIELPTPSWARTP
jgi:AAA ATPase-like protein